MVSCLSSAFAKLLEQIVPLSTTHRLDDSEVERKRVELAGREVAQSTVEGMQVGPLRVWPGGLAMARTLGDSDAGDAVSPVPDVWQVRLALPALLLPRCF